MEAAHWQGLIGIKLAAGFVHRHGDAEHRSEIGDALGFKEAAAVAQIRIGDMATLVDQEGNEAVDALQIFTGEDGDGRFLGQPLPGIGIGHLQRVFQP